MKITLIPTGEGCCSGGVWFFVGDDLISTSPKGVAPWKAVRAGKGNAWREIPLLAEAVDGLRQEDEVDNCVEHRLFLQTTES